MSSNANDENPWIKSVEESQQQQTQTGEAIIDENVAVRRSTRLASKASFSPSISDWPLPKIYWSRQEKHAEKKKPRASFCHWCTQAGMWFFQFSPIKPFHDPEQRPSFVSFIKYSVLDHRHELQDPGFGVWVNIKEFGKSSILRTGFFEHCVNHSTTTSMTTTRHRVTGR
ncbi:7-cyano-7-deazaguanine synthase [Labeo rohita]|uniref:7-cyano-7-deazaguanine synthase n=1 Tax=Labeo rohita TaxID=84645 RepID=A0ABQ8L8S1_LABRO|nr:7-cyano-7-deazaguanine synthase [Labeo rohita]